MKIPVSWVVNGGLWFGEGFSSKREVTAFKRQVQDHVNEFDVAGIDDDVRAHLVAKHLNKEYLDKGQSIALVVESALIDYSEATRRMTVAAGEAIAKGDMDKANEIFGNMMCSLTPRFRNRILSMMDALDKEDHRAIHHLLRAVDDVEVGIKAAKAASAA